MSYAIGIDVGATNIKAACVTEAGDVLERRSLPTEDDPEGSWADRVRAEIERTESRRGGASWIGICAPGYARPDGSAIAWMQGRMEALQGFDWSEALGRRVPVLNDAHAALVGEAWRGAAAGARDAILLTLGTGVGGAVLSGGALLKGHLGRAGHLGHTTLDLAAPPDIAGTPGSLEDAIGNCTLEARSGGRYRTIEELVEAHLRGEPIASRVWLDSIYALACAIASVINVVDPEVAVIGGGVARAGKALFEPLEAYLEEVEWRPAGTSVRIVPAALGEYGGAIGAARNAMLAAEAAR